MTEVAMACDFGAICLLLLTPACTRFRFSSGIPFLFVPLSIAFFGAAKSTKIGIALFVFAITLLEHGRTLRARLKEPGFKKAIALVSASFVLFIWDELKFHCEPGSWLQGHSLWHLGSAWAIAEYGRWRFGRET